MADQPKIGEPLWWVKRLHKKLGDQAEQLALYSDYYEGKHRLAFATTKFREAFGNLFTAFADNWCDLVVDAVEERLNVEGFRFPTEGEEADPTAGDQDAWDIWQSNNLDSVSQMVHTDALINGCSYVLVAPPESGTSSRATITGEAAGECITENGPGTSKAAAGFKEWRDDWTGRVMATLYLPDRIYRYQSDRPVQSESLGESTTINWVPRENAGDAELTNPLGVVPLVPFENRPRLRRPGRSEIKTVIPMQDAVNKLCADLIVASEFQAFRQRVLMGAEVPVDPVTNQPIDAFKHAVNRLWLVDNPDAKAFEFGEIDLRNFVEAVAMFVQHVASQTRTPPHYFFLRGQFPSGESIKAAETGLVAKSHRKMRFFGEGWEYVIRLAFRIANDARAKATNAETIWGDPESRTESEHIDAVVKKQSLGVPQEQLWEDAGYTPQQIERFKEMRAAEAALAPVPTITIGSPNGNGARPTSQPATGQAPAGGGGYGG